MVLLGIKRKSSFMTSVFLSRAAVFPLELLLLLCRLAVFTNFRCTDYSSLHIFRGFFFFVVESSPARVLFSVHPFLLVLTDSPPISSNASDIGLSFRSGRSKRSH